MLAEKILLSVLVSLGLCAGCCVADSGLPLIQISHDEDMDDDFPEMREEVHLEDFFWTGSGDGPPDYLKKVHTGISKGKDVIVKTETVVATVYVDGNNEIDIPICLDCPPDDGGGTWDAGGMPPLNYSATDRRYWLLTVMSGFYSQKDNPSLEERLARLYRLAFTRQQSRHLGINGAQQIAGIAVSAGRNRRGQQVTDAPPIDTTTPKDLDDEAEMLDLVGSDAQSNIRPTPPKRNTNRNTEWETSSEESENAASSISITETNEYTAPSTLEVNVIDENGMSGATTQLPYMTILPWELIQEDAKSEKLQATAALLASQAALIPLQLQNPLLRSARVRVIIHNITQITEDELQRGLHSVGAYDDDVNEKVDERPIANQTELIYTVFVNGRPVIATTAANDMKLVSETEAANVIGQEVYMKAEPYLREPQATPLAPAIRSGQAGFIDSIQNNTALVVVSSVAILLLLLLLVALLLVGRGRVRERERLQEQRTTSRNALLSETQSGRATSTEAGLNTGRSTVHSRDVGVQNFSFENDGTQHRRQARINFPSPPMDRDYHNDSLTSSDNTSDSSVYCPINPPAPDVQRILDDKTPTLFDKRHCKHHEYDQAEGRENAIYTTVISEKKHDKNRRKAKRRYLSENRVGSLETSPRTHHTAPSSGDEIVSGSLDDEQLSPTYANFERNEAYNPHNNYNRNKLLHQKSMFSDKDEVEQLQATEAINKEIIHALQPAAEKSSDTGSIGSFLSMASVKAFPKNSLPQPLNRVLDPVFVTYYDNVEDPSAKKQQSSTGRPLRKQQSRHETLNEADIATIESFPTPKAPSQTHLGSTQSDNPDPGVVGPIVWERHKKRMQDAAAVAGDAGDDAEEMLLRYNEKYGNNPGAIRNHYEDLLESAIHMYSSEEDLPMPLPTHDFNNKRKPTKRENRGSSAGSSSFGLRLHSTEPRPATAQPAKISASNQSTQPPSPASDAWGGSIYGSHSPLMRPLSAGPFQRSETFQVIGPPRSASNRSDLSAEPLIEAIKSELRRFKDEQH